MVSSGELTLVAVGPLTNVAMAIRMDPAFGQRLKKCYIMGGNYLGKKSCIIITLIILSIRIDRSEQTGFALSVIHPADFIHSTTQSNGIVYVIEQVCINDKHITRVFIRPL